MPIDGRWSGSSAVMPVSNDSQGNESIAALGRDELGAIAFLIFYTAAVLAVLLYYLDGVRP